MQVELQHRDTDDRTKMPEGRLLDRKPFTEREQGGHKFKVYDKVKEDVNGDETDSVAMRRRDLHHECIDLVMNVIVTGLSVTPLA